MQQSIYNPVDYPKIIALTQFGSTGKQQIHSMWEYTPWYLTTIFEWTILFKYLNPYFWKSETKKISSLFQRIKSILLPYCYSISSPFLFHFCSICALSQFIRSLFPCYKLTTSFVISHRLIIELNWPLVECIIACFDQTQTLLKFSWFQVNFLNQV